MFAYNIYICVCVCVCVCAQYVLACVWNACDFIKYEQLLNLKTEFLNRWKLFWKFSLTQDNKQ